LEPTPLTQDHHCLDTWFSSGLFHKSSLGWPLENNVIGDLIVTGYDILFFWITRMILMSVALDDELPFKNVLFHGLVRDKYGQKMSKTKGNTIDPYSIGSTMGWDNVRLTLALNSINNNDLKISEDSFKDTQKILNKIKNAHVYCSPYLKNSMDKPFSKNKILNDMMAITENFILEYQQLMENFQCNQGVKTVIYDFFYQHFCDYFIEIHKIIRGNNPEADDVLSWIFYQSLLLIHPDCPFLTEEIFSKYHDTTLLSHSLKSKKIVDCQEFYSTMNIISVIRFFQQVFQSKSIEINCQGLEIYKDLCSAMTKTTIKDIEGIIVYGDNYGFTWYLNNINNNPEILTREIQKCNQKIQQMERLLGDQNFLKNGDPVIIEQYKTQLKNSQIMLNCLKSLD
jgi:valyl-tRNA synthetase